MQLNNFRFTIPVDGHAPEIEYNTVITLTPIADNSTVGESIRTVCEIEIMQGKKVLLESGSTEYRMNLNNFKLENFKKVILQTFF